MRHPSLYQINTRILMRERGVALGRPATLDDVPDAMIDDIAGKGFAWVWFLGVWQTGEAARQVSLSNPKLRAAFAQELPDLRDEDVVGSPFAIKAYETHRDFGGDPALARLRERLARRGLKLMLDFVPNHVAPDHPWATQHPEYLVHGRDEDLAREPQNYVSVSAGGRRVILAHGRDPYFDGWPDTLQLNYRHAGLREAQMTELQRVAERCDGVRCDMAMLVQPAIFQRTWGERSLPSDGSPPKDAPFWPEAIKGVRRKRPSFLFAAEVYWDMEWELQQMGFDYTYDKRLYDRLREGAARPVREHLMADPSFRDRSLRFLENHDEPRAAEVFAPAVHRAAAVIGFFVPGLRLFHEGQLEGRKVHVSMHLARRPAEPVDQALQAFYTRLLAALARPEAHEGRWQLWPCRPAWDGNPTHDQFVVCTWDGGERRLLAVANYGPSQGQCYVTLEIPELRGRRFALVDQLSDARFEREGDGLVGPGLYLDLPPWGHHVFALEPA